MTCTSCGKQFNGKIYPKGMCQSCYNYFRKGGKINPLPPNGVIQYDERGYVICHICGRAYKKLGGHIKESHNMTIKAYKEMFGLCENCKTTESSYATVMHNYANLHNNAQMLIKVGINTRIKKGQNNMRLGKMVRLQEIIEKRNRRYKHGK